MVIKGNLFTSYYSQFENQLTEAFLKVLMHGTAELTDAFLDFVGVQGEYVGYKYDFQFGRAVQMSIDRAVLIGIAETEIVHPGTATPQDEEDEEQEGIPDGYLYASHGSCCLNIKSPQSEVRKKNNASSGKDSMNKKFISFLLHLANHKFTKELYNSRYMTNTSQELFRV
ncbi:hypothetical protein ASD40_35675 [Paenibacillus sp. Root444D2]|nr:hypothetical protein ASD40_35675 [Paenibacillus sp. Root444D2]KRE44263.1 hypothetical protein ASG85_33000 [Paenibacillus sp. Soil724D2]